MLTSISIGIPWIAWYSCYNIIIGMSKVPEDYIFLHFNLQEVTATVKVMVDGILLP